MSKKQLTGLQFRPVRLDEDLDAIFTIDKLSFRTPWPLSVFLEELKSNLLAKYIVATIAGNVIGYGGWWFLMDEAHLTTVAVHPDFRGLGIGEAIVTGIIKTAVQEGALSMFLEVRVSNKVAQNLYKKLGFRYLDVRRGYYADLEDAIVMKVSL